jgi:hypothetical protein
VVRSGAVALLVFFALGAGRAGGSERLCDASFEDCRTPLLELISNERVGIDVAFWFMEDLRYSSALIERWRAGVPVRVIMDSRALPVYPHSAAPVAALKDAGIPMLDKPSLGIVHWKFMLFAGQNVVEFSGANFSPHAFVPVEPYVDYIDEVIYFSDDPGIVDSFKTAFDGVWTATSGFAPYADITAPRTRQYPVYPVHPEMTFHPFQDFAARSLPLYEAETDGIDTIMFRVEDERHTDAVVAAVARGVPVRLITDEDEYRDPTRPRHAYNIDRLYAGGVQLRMEAHRGALHQKTTILRAQQLVIFGSQNWTGGPNMEHSIFTGRPLFLDFFPAQFERKWNNAAGYIETKPFVPLPPDAPLNVSPPNAAGEVPRSVTLQWYAGPWGQRYDIHFGTTSDPPLVAADVRLGPSESPSHFLSYTVADLEEGTTYYWKVVSRTMAGMTRSGPVWNFRTEGAVPEPPDPGDVVLYAARAAITGSRWTRVGDATAADGVRVGSVDQGIRYTAAAQPADYLEATFVADAGVPYRIWVRGKAERNRWANDSLFAQFDDSVGAAGSPWYRIGTTSAAVVTIEDCSGCGLSSWGWNDNGYGAGVLGPAIYFASSGTHRIRLQIREDGLWIDQIVLSRDRFLWDAPGGTKDDGTILPPSGGTTAPAPDVPRLPDGWESADVGTVGIAGSASEKDGTFAVSGAGADIWGTADGFHFAFRPLPGDGEIVARVAGLSGTHAWTKAGVMIRGSTAPDAPHAFMLVSTGKGAAFQWRASSGAITQHASGGARAAPQWVRLVRAGTRINAYVSADGASWTLIGSEAFVMPAEALVGLAVTSHDTTALASAGFDGVAVTASQP